jgi:hypothetical protein
MKQGKRLAFFVDGFARQANPAMAARCTSPRVSKGDMLNLEVFLRSTEIKQLHSDIALAHARACAP